MDLQKTIDINSRRATIEKELAISLPNIGTHLDNYLIASKKNCENMIGCVQIPIGIAGPLKIGFREYYLPLATTEGALVASVNRGCKAITQSGGATVMVTRIGTTRGPVFETSGIEQAQLLTSFLSSNFSKLQEIATQSSPFISLQSYSIKSIGKNFFIRFIFNTQDAMGMNMVTISTRDIVSYITDKTGIRCLSLSGNFCVDKKASWLNFISGRGFEVNAEIVLNSSVISTVLKTSASAIYDVWLSKCLIGSAISGSMGFNAHFANVVAAIFTATGQDLAHVVEGSLGITNMDIEDDNLYVSVSIPALMVGIVGGGTGLSSQQESLSIMGIDSKSNSSQLATIIGAAVLAGEISLLSSLSEDSLVSAHIKLGRYK